MMIRIFSSTCIISLLLLLCIICSKSFGAVADWSFSLADLNKYGLWNTRGGSTETSANDGLELDDLSAGEAGNCTPEVSTVQNRGSHWERFSRIGQRLSGGAKKKLTNHGKQQQEGRRFGGFWKNLTLASQRLWAMEGQAQLDKPLDDVMEHDDEVTFQSDLTRRGRHMTVITTAALPWMTGTAVNPLLRAAYLVRETQQINQNNHQWVTLLIPWLELSNDQEEVYHKVFENEKEQEEYIRTWLREQANMPDAADPKTGLKITFYPSRYHATMKSIFAMGDICSLVDDDEADVAILEEPEHLNWYRAPGDSYTKKFSFVVGIVHTNYKKYAATQYHGKWTAPALALLSSAMVRAYCHKVIKLSDVLQTFCTEKESTSNVHGVRADFLATPTTIPASNQENKVYFIGKLIWAKGLDILLELQDYYREYTGDYFPITVYGSGPDQRDIKRAYLGRKALEQARKKDSKDGGMSLEVLQNKAKEQLEKIRRTLHNTASEQNGNNNRGLIPELDFPKTFHELRRQPIPATFPGRVDHALLRDTDNLIFVNPSVTEVLCTTTAEALAMGKFVIIPVHPSNTFFMKFPNCLAYRDKFEFAANLRWAMTHQPEPLTPELRSAFTWEAATERFIQASAVTNREARERERLGRTKLDERIAWFHNELGKGNKGDALRKVLGAGPASEQFKYVQQQQQEQQQQQQQRLQDAPASDKKDDAFSGKLSSSSLAKAIRSTLANCLATLIII